MKVILTIIFLALACNTALSQNCGTTQCTSYRNLNDREYKKRVLDKTNAIFEGEIIFQSELVNPAKSFPYRNLKVKILRFWKGISNSVAEVEIRFNYYDNDCAMIGESGKRVFYASIDGESSKLSTGQCSKVNDSEKRKLIKILGKGKSINKI